MMQDGPKTLIFVAAAGVLSLTAWFSYPKPRQVNVKEGVGKELFAFEDPGDAASLEIVRYLEDLGEIHTFKVAKNPQTGAWTIPSHSDYPADAEQQMRDAALSLIGIKALDVATEDPAEQVLYGVVAPDAQNLKMGDQGVGLKVEVEDAKGQKLVSLIVGKQVKGSQNQRFVRRPGQDVVYVAEIDPSKLSTRFEDWIEPDLLKINPLDVESLKLRDYSVVQTLQGGALEKRSEIFTNWNATDNRWDLEKMVVFKGREAIPTELLPGETLNTEKLNGLKNALDDLKIVDVRAKPPGLGADLQAEAGFLDNAENRRNLMTRGFYASASPDGRYELYAANGELYVGVKDGYEYILRFGNVASSEEGTEEGKLNRYLFVTARLDESKFPMPTLTPLPKDAAAETAPPPPPGNEAAAGTEKPVDEAAEEQKRKLAAERERIEKENERKVNEWKDRKKQAENKVRELNARFAGWYYVISEDVYKNVHLSRTDVLTEGSAAREEGFGVDAFRDLEKQGLPNRG